MCYFTISDFLVVCVVCVTRVCVYVCVMYVCMCVCVYICVSRMSEHVSVCV